MNSSEFSKHIETELYKARLYLAHKGYQNPELLDLPAIYALQSLTKEMSLNTIDEAVSGSFVDEIRAFTHEQLERAFQTAIVAVDNDVFRVHGPHEAVDLPGKIGLTPGVHFSPNRDQILQAVRKYDAFTVGNDPYDEHDFGKVKVDNQQYFFKLVSKRLSPATLNEFTEAQKVISTSKATGF